jgi:hypothetical protein
MVRGKVIKIYLFSLLLFWLVAGISGYFFWSSAEDKYYAMIQIVPYNIIRVATILAIYFVVNIILIIPIKLFEIKKKFTEESKIKGRLLTYLIGFCLIVFLLGTYFHVVTTTDIIIDKYATERECKEYKVLDKKISEYGFRAKYKRHELIIDVDTAEYVLKLEKKYWEEVKKNSTIKICLRRSLAGVILLDSISCIK